MGPFLCLDRLLGHHLFQARGAGAVGRGAEATAADREALPSRTEAEPGPDAAPKMLPMECRGVRTRPLTMVSSASFSKGDWIS